jgi:SSS family solute:Na+ symporter
VNPQKLYRPEFNGTLAGFVVFLGDNFHSHKILAAGENAPMTDLTWRGFAFALAAATLFAGEDPHTLHAWAGKTPVLDGAISPGEWDDATVFTGVLDWTHTFTPTTNPRDLAFTGYVKHDATRLYFAFDVTDDVLYGIDTRRWLPTENPNAHDLTPKGYPWFGDEIELLINAANKWSAHEGAAGNGTSWQMVCNLTKSRLGGIGKGGLLEGEPRSKPEVWENYQRWIVAGAQQAVAKQKPRGHGYVIEWAISFQPCLEVEPGKFYSPAMGDRQMGLNIAIGDLDQPSDGAGTFGNFHHEEWFAGHPQRRTELREWGTLWIHGGPKL